ncbi:hypothetical protein DEI81_13965 [Curtobacterium sp. MCBD17_013]|uniref:outer membrane protein assembly factor BamB family protein n=1 Tax=Curtobacterium sp. MCBD17_013 TaxID=2175668 RepID=UPI000DA6DF5B|nr:PQQ-binding-like beta-propeller repeat protein [Curtobacterium sp. MCBD17_013]PZF59379.1 hypothetical protein DEI81_13965 [Curtobacterium sp. MCBD17_013]
MTTHHDRDRRCGVRLRTLVVPVAVLLLAGCTAGRPSVAPTTPPPSAGAPAGTASTRSDGPSAPSGPSTGTGPSRAAASDSWPSYHGTATLTGAVPAGAPLDHATRRWSVDLGGTVQGQPVAADGRIVAATERNRVVALDPTTGHVLWSRTLGTPLTHVAAVAGCGDIDPLGITSTPAIDPATRIVYVVAEVDAGRGVVHHVLSGLDLATGRTVRTEDVDPPLPAGESPVHLLQRVSLAVANGRVYAGYGGNAGDCGHYHGWVVGVRESGAPDPVSFEVAPDGEGGAVWESGGGIAVGADGHLFVTTGNANPDPPQGGPDPERYTESVVELSPDLRPLAAFKDRVAGGDEDLSTSNPVLLPGGLVFAVGKTDTAFVLRQGDLSQVTAIRHVCGSDPDGAPAFDRRTDRVFVPCRGGGIQRVDLATRTLGPRLAGANSGPTLIGRHLWAVEYPTGTVSEWDPRSGRRLQTLHTGTALPTFATPTSVDGLLLVPTVHGVTAFAGRSS